MNDSGIAFIGGGNMTRAIAGGLIAGGFDSGDILISEPSADARRILGETLPGVRVSEYNGEVATAAACVVLAVKPQVLAQVGRELAPSLVAHRPLVISIAAGIRCADIDAWLGGGFSIVRIMPNQPALIGRGVSGLFANARASRAERERAIDIMSAVGAVVPVASEADLDTVTAVSGSGPAYFFLLIDMLTKTAVELGLDAEAARELAVETARGAAELAAHEDTDMADLIARVRSPGGTTAAALDHLDAANLRAIFAEAVTAARDRAIVLADAAHTSQSSD